MSNIKNIGVKFTSLFLSSLFVVTMGGCSLNKDKSNEFSSSTSYTQISNIKSDDKVDMIDTSINFDKCIEYEEIDNNELKERFSSCLDKFKPDVRERLECCFNNICDNFSDLECCLNVNGFPSNGIIYERFVKSLEKVNDIVWVTNEDDNYYDYYSKYGGSCYSNDENKIYIITNQLEDSEYNRIFTEEVIHVGQDELLRSDYVDFNLVGEGEANLFSFLLNDGKIMKDDFCSLVNDKNDSITLYGAGHGLYTFNTRYYVYLMSLVGYNELDNFKKNHDTDSLISKISSNYDIDGEAFYNDMRKVVLDGINGSIGEDYDLVCSIENRFFKCMEQRVDSIDDENSMNDFLQLNRFINLQFSSVYEKFLKEKDGEFIYDNPISCDFNSLLNEKIDNKLSKLGMNIDSSKYMGFVESYNTYSIIESSFNAKTK